MTKVLAPLLAIISILASALPAVPAYAGDLLLFPSLTSHQRSQSDPGLKGNELIPAVDIFYTAETGKLRFLAEYYASSREKDLERLQLGWNVMNGKTLWAGRFHNPLSYWNTELHHGIFLQTSVTRPSIANYEDEQGPIPAHIAGLLIESSRTSGDGEISYLAGIGIGPTLDGTLKPFDLLDPKHPGKVAGSFRIGYHPEAGSATQFGVALGYAQITVNNIAPINEVRQSVVSTFANWEHGAFKLIGELFALDNRVSGMAYPTRSTMLSAYLQPEYRAVAQTTLFGRLEGTSRAAHDSYLSLFPEFATRQLVAGGRYDLTAAQAIKLEAARSRRQDGLEFNQISAQWSMVLP